MIKPSLLFSLLLLAALPLCAGNSVFSYDGYPIQFYGKDIYSLSMGDTGASDIFRNNTGYANPALHNLNNRSLFSTGLLMGYNAYSSKDDSGTYDYLDNSLDFPYFSLSIPLKRHRLGFQVNSFASGVVSNQREFAIADTTFWEKQEMDRYIYRVDLIYSVSLGRNNLGISGNYYFGHEVRKFEQEIEYGLFNTREELARDYKNPSFTVGYLRHYDKVAFGAYYSHGGKLTGEEVRTSIHEEEEPVDFDHTLPKLAGLSLTTLPAKEFKVAADLTYEAWDQVDGDVYDPGWKAGLGVAYEPTRSDYEKSGLRIPLRTGFSYRHLPFQVSGNSVNELAFTLGASIPLQGDVNRIDLGFQYQRRGDLDLNKLEDNSFLFMFGLTGFDILGKATNRKAPREIPVMEDVNPW